MAITEPPVTMRSACSFAPCDQRGLENHDSQRSRISEHFGCNLCKGRPLLYWNLQESNSSAGHLSFDRSFVKQEIQLSLKVQFHYQLVVCRIPASSQTKHQS